MINLKQNLKAKSEAIPVEGVNGYTGDYCPSTQLYDSHKESSKRNNLLSVSFLFFLTYVSVMSLSITDAQLLMQSSGVEMPLLGISIPFVWFFFVSPVLIAVFYFNLTANLVEHAKNVACIKKELKSAKKDAAAMSLASFFWDFAFISKSIFFRIFHFFILFALPLFALGIIMYQYGKLQETFGLCVQVAIMVALLILFLIYRFRVMSILGLKKMMFFVYLILSLVIASAAISYVLIVYGYVNEKSLVNEWWAVKKANIFFSIKSVIALDISHNESILLPQIDQWIAYNKSILGKETTDSLSSVFNDASIPRMNLSKRSLKDIDMPHAFLPKANFHESNLKGAYLQGGNFQGADFSGAVLQLANLSDGSTKNEFVNYEHAAWAKDLYRGANLDGVNFSGADLSGANLTGVSAQAVDFSTANLNHVNLSGANLSVTDLYTDIRGADFTGANLFAADFSALAGMDTGNNTSIVIVKSAKTRDASFYQANLQFANFKEVDLAGVYFAEANLQIGYFGGAHLQGADFANAHLQGADFSNADLRGADFSNADLRGADFTGANLQGTIFLNSDLYGAEISSEDPFIAFGQLENGGVQWDELRKMPDAKAFENRISAAQAREKKIGWKNVDLIENHTDNMILERWKDGLKNIKCSDNFCRKYIARSVLTLRPQFDSAELSNKYYSVILEVYDGWKDTMPDTIKEIERINPKLRDQIVAHIRD
jgi:uncharacterized protein YjbI with pentapeptide repeats